MKSVLVPGPLCQVSAGLLFLLAKSTVTISAIGGHFQIDNGPDINTTDDNNFYPVLFCIEQVPC